MGATPATDSEAALDIAAGEAYALLSPPATARSSLYRVDLATGAAELVGDVGPAGHYRALALIATARLARAPIHALFDDWPDVDPQFLFLPLERNRICPPDAAYRELTLPQALDSARGFLRARAGQGALDAFAASPESATATAAVRAAALAASRGEPGAALAALLGAHELEPAQSATLSTPPPPPSQAASACPARRWR